MSLLTTYGNFSLISTYCLSRGQIKGVTKLFFKRGYRCCTFAFRCVIKNSVFLLVKTGKCILGFLQTVAMKGK